MYLLVYIENFNIKIKRYTSFTNIVNKKKLQCFKKILENNVLIKIIKSPI